MDRELSNARVIKKLPHLFGRNATLPHNLAGATILQIGTFQDDRLVDGGGLVIDYRRSDEEGDRRLVLAFNDTAMWVDSDQQIAPCRAT